MVVSHVGRVEGKEYNGNGAKSVIKKSVLGPQEGWKDYVMRVFELEAKGYSPRHTHPWPHIVYVIYGKGIIHIDGTDHEVQEGSFAYVPENSLHQFLSGEQEKLSFICIVPPEGDA